ncbi:MAG: hypothetical protein RLZZ136_671 [Pseudomonadota bacterium]|jgi:MarR family transcriptional regulator for hemolysin
MDNRETHDIGLRLSVIARMLQQDFDRQMIGQGITRSQWTLVVVAARNPGATQRQIAEILNVSEASAGRLIDRLCIEGLLERQEKTDDRRARLVYITDKAKPLLERMTSVARENDHRIFSGFEEAELQTLSTLLNKLYNRLNK